MVISAMVMVAPLFAAEPSGEHLGLDSNWKFHLGDDWPDALVLNKAGMNRGPASESFNDAAWRTVNLPHDWVVELPFDPTADHLHGYKPVGPNFPKTSVGWYRRVFELATEDAGKRIYLQFDGAYRDTRVFVNGWFVGRQESGYYPFRYDITDVVNFGGKNTVSVRVDASRFEGWFYEGAGIYRHVWLDKTPPLALDEDGIFVYGRFKDNLPEGPAAVHVEVGLRNTLANAADATVNCSILAPGGRSVARFSAKDAIPAVAKREVKLAARVESPVLWSPETPNLYKLVTTIEVGGKIIARKETEFGLRTVAFDVQKGFLLNGKPYMICGTCNHQDHAGVGVAVPDALQYYRVQRLKDIACNAYRVAHNPPAPALLEACDRLGMLVMDENRLLGSDEENLRLLETQIRRDRNHPSVFIWSLGNEEPRGASEAGGAIAKTMRALIKRLDPTRPVTLSAMNVSETGACGSVLDVRGWNYWVGPRMEEIHAKFPTQSHFGSEQRSLNCDRGVFKDDGKRCHMTSMKRDGAKNPFYWSYFVDHPWMSGAFVWSGLDYRGEPTPHVWPCVSGHFGLLDTCGFAKASAFFFKSWWTKEPVLHLLPHWNWPGLEGKEIEVQAFSNCQEVELFLNGQSLGRQKISRDIHVASWTVKYAPGTIEVKGYDAGKQVAEAKVETTGAASSVQLVPDRAPINADGADASLVTVSVTDAQGRVVPSASNLVRFAISGPGRIIGVGNGDPTCLEADSAVGEPPVRSIPINEWRWKMAKISKAKEVPPECANRFDDAAWDKVVFPTGKGPELGENQYAIYRAHVSVTREDLDNPGLELRFAGFGNDSIVYVNGTRVRDIRDWAPPPPLDVKRNLRVGDNTVVVMPTTPGGETKRALVGGLRPGVSLEIIGTPAVPAWSRSVFNGLAQVIVQSTGEAGEIKLTASAGGLRPAVVSLHAGEHVSP